MSCDDFRDDVKFFLSTETQNRTELSSENLDEVDVENPTVFIIHGWTTSSNDTWIIDLTAEFLAEEDYNVIAVDYTPIGQQEYATAVSNIKYVGK